MEGLPGHPVRGRRHRPCGRTGPGPGRALSPHSAPRRVVLLRHARTASNADGRIQGQLDVPLDEVGRRQATAVAAALAGHRVDVLASSDLSRARETAEALAGGGPLRLDRRLRELDLGTWQGLTSREAEVAHPEQYAAWRAGVDVARGGGETYAAGGARAAACLLELLESVPAGGTLLAVTHGGTARAALGTLALPGAAPWPVLAALGNTCLSTLVEGQRGWRLERHNAGTGPLLGPATGAHDPGAAPARVPGADR